MVLGLHRTTCQAIYGGVSVAVTALILSCNKSPTQPSRPAQQPAAPPITAIRLDGPTALAPGEVGHFTATAAHGDGSSEDVTATAGWSILWTGPDPDHSGPNVLHIIGAGTVQAVVPGDASVRVQIPSQAGSPAVTPTRAILVLEPGTFRISGTVASAGQPESAAIEIVSGTGGGARTISDGLAGVGQYALYGAAGTVELRASAGGFEPQLRRIVVTDNTTSDFDLKPVLSPTDVSGSWVATLSEAPGCRANAPQAAWERQFDLDITQQNTHLSITRTSPTFLESCTRNRPATEQGRIFGQTLSFLIVGDTYGSDYSWPCLFDRLSPTEWLGISGSVQATVNGSTIRGTMDTGQGGAFDLYESTPAATSPSGPPTAICHAPDHIITIRRR
jgi:hypothetical protein